MERSEILFDHFYVVLPSDYYQAIKSDPWWKRFFPKAHEQTVRTGEGNEWTGFYSSDLRNRYVEIFYEGPRLNEGYVSGAAGLGLCSEEMGVTPKIKTYFESICSDPVSIVSRTYASKKLNRDIPWFTYFMPPMLTTPFLKTWIMDYDPEFISLGNNVMKSPSRFDRDHFGTPPLGDAGHAVVHSIESIQLACRPDEISPYSQHLVGLGFVQNGEHQFSLSDIQLILNPSERIQNRITEVRFRLDREIENATHSIHTGQIIASGRHLTWRI